MFLKQFFIVLFLIISNVEFGQKTNVIIPCLIDSQNTKNVVFQNGDKLNVVYEKDDLKFDTWDKYTNKPTVLITKTGDYLYNHRAIIDKRNICSSGMHVINSKDITEKILQKKEICFNIYEKVNCLNFSPSCTEEAFYTIEREKYQILLSDPFYFQDIWSSEKKSLENIPNITLYDYKSSNFEYYTTYSGGATRCVYNNYKEYFKNNDLLYEKLIPIKYSEFKKSIISEINNFNYLVENETFNYRGELKFDDEGKNVSKLSYSATFNLKKLEDKINKVVNSWTEFPYFEDIFIKCSAPINIKIERKNDLKSKYSYLTQSTKKELNLKNINEKNLINLLNDCINNQFKFNYKTINYRIEFNGYLENEPSINLLNKVKGKGPIYSLLSVVPGLGQLKIKQQDGYRKLRLWQFSVPMGAIAIASKIYSNYYYSKFLSDLDGSNSRKYYKLANFSQKVFMSSLGVYSLMSLVDFSITFTIGCKNKALQYSVNQKIRKTL